MFYLGIFLLIAAVLVYVLSNQIAGICFLGMGISILVYILLFTEPTHRVCNFWDAKPTPLWKNSRIYSVSLSNDEIVFFWIKSRTNKKHFTQITEHFFIER